ncbi:uncharacterized protein CTRU02_209878 [Colletotrichum truncatum]|uniref:Uncharacterized protein n=1 Tax=Colletotrichum truncatum TaxID=5467 RepID=A0ACC3YTS7_COLTU
MRTITQGHSRTALALIQDSQEMPICRLPAAGATDTAGIMCLLHAALGILQVPVSVVLAPRPLVWPGTKAEHHCYVMRVLGGLIRWRVSVGCDRDAR